MTERDFDFLMIVADGDHHWYSAAAWVIYLREFREWEEQAETLACATVRGKEW